MACTTSITDFAKRKVQYTVKFETIDGVKVTIENLWADDVENAIFEARKMLTEQLECVGVDRQA